MRVSAVNLMPHNSS